MGRKKKEDKVEEKKEENLFEKVAETFEEKYVEDFARALMPMLIKDAVSFQLSPKELIYGLFLIAKGYKEYSKLTTIMEESQIGNPEEWCESRVEKWMKDFEEKGVIEKAKKSVILGREMIKDELKAKEILEKKDKKVKWN